MPDITYSIGGTDFDAVPETLEDNLHLSIASEATLGRAQVHVVGVAGEVIVLVGKYMTKAVRDAIKVLFDACHETGATTTLDDGYTERTVLIRSFETIPLVGKTEGFSFRLELIVIPSGD